MSKEKTAIIFANISAISLVIIKLLAWIFTWSIAVISSAIDSALDFLVSTINFLILKRSQSPLDDEYNYWHWKIEGVWAIFEWMVVWVSWLVIIYMSIIKILNDKWVDQIDISIYVMVVSILITWTLVWYLSKVYKETKNLVIKSDMLHYKSDLMTNAWVILSLIVIKFTWWSILDSVISIIISSYILKSSWEIILEWFEMIMDKSIHHEFIDKIKDIIYSHQSVNSYHLLKTRKSWKLNFVEFHLVFDGDIKLSQAHFVWESIELQIKWLIENCIVTIHFDTYDDSHIELSNVE